MTLSPVTQLLLGSASAYAAGRTVLWLLERAMRRSLARAGRPWRRRDARPWPVRDLATGAVLEARARGDAR